MSRDYTLVVAWRNGNLKAGEDLFDENAEKLGRWIAGQLGFDAPELVDDIVGETFYRVAKKIDGFRGEATFYTWLCSIAHLVRLEMAKKEVRYVSVGDISESVFSKEISYFGNPEEIVINLEESAAMKAAFATLKPEHQQILEYRLIEHLKYEQISQMTGRSIDSLEKANRTALKALEKNFREIY